MPYEAVVFDMDGVLADSEPVYLHAMNATLAPFGKAVDEALQLRIMGSGVRGTWVALTDALRLDVPLEELIAAYDSVLCQTLGELHEPLPGVRELIEGLRQRGVPSAVASSSLPAWIEALLGGLGLGDAFDALVSSTMVEHGKPAPDIYLEAARRLGKEAERCIAVEDTPTGLASAKAAGMLTVQVRSSSTAWPPQPEADVVLESLQEFDLGLLEGKS